MDIYLSLDTLSEAICFHNKSSRVRTFEFWKGDDKSEGNIVRIPIGESMAVVALRQIVLEHTPNSGKANVEASYPMTVGQPIEHLAELAATHISPATSDANVIAQIRREIIDGCVHVDITDQVHGIIVGRRMHPADHSANREKRDYHFPKAPYVRVLEFETIRSSKEGMSHAI